MNIMNKIGTSIEQSQKLIELGLDVNTADMMWDDWSLIDEGWKLNVGYYPEIEQDYGRKCYPAWSLAALFDVLPKYIGDYGKCLYYDIGGYYCGYMDDGDFMLTIEETMADNPVDACYEMILRLHEQELL